MENVRLLTETREALEQQTATAEVLQVINSSPGELAPVFDAMLDRAMHLCEAAFGTLWTYDGTSFHAAALHRVPKSYAEAQSGVPVPTRPGSVLGKIAAGSAYAQILDAAVDESYQSPTARALVELGGARTVGGVALRKDEVLLGAITIYRQEVKLFSDKQIALLQNFATQAVIAMENARLMIETREALEQQTATAEVLGVINSSPGDLAPVFEAILEKAHDLCNAACGGLIVRNGDLFHTVAIHGEPGFAEFWRGQGPFRPDDRYSPIILLLRGEKVVHFADARDDDGYSSTPAYQRLIDAAGARTLLLVPLRKDGVLLGAITAFRQEVRPFTEKEIGLLQNFAAQAVIAMENARLLTETRETLEQQTATAEVLQVINSSPGDLAPVFDAILEKAHDRCGAAEGALVQFDGEHFRAVATRGYREEFVAVVRQPFRGNAFHQRLIDGERYVHVQDTHAAASELYDSVGRGTLQLTDARTFLLVPLRKDNRLLGHISAARPEVQPFTDKQIALLENFAAQAVIAMENARLLTETREALEQQTATAEVLEVINSSPGDLTPVFDAMLERATRLCGAAGGSLWSYDGEAFQVLAATIGDIGQMMHPGPDTSLGRIARGESVVQIADVETEPAYQADLGQTRTRLAGTRTALAVALRKDARLVGAITAGRHEVRPFTDKEIALLENFAAQAVIAMENARLLTETREALEQQTATAEVLQVINSSPGDLAPVFDTMLEKAMVLCGFAHGTLQAYDGDQFHAVAVRGLPEPLAGLLRQSFRLGPKHPMRQLLEGARFVRIPDLTKIDDPEVQQQVRVAVESGSRSLLCVPLRKDDVLLGQIVAVRREVRPFSDKQIALLENFAAQAVIAMESARLLGELRQRTDEVAELNRGLEARVAEQVEELGRVGRLKRFLAPQLAELIVSQGDEKILESHRREIVVVFCDLRGYTAFTETAEPEEVLEFLREYHGALGPLVAQFEGTLDQFSGDGIMVFFNDPVPCPDPAERAVKMAMAMREAAGKLIAGWRRHSYELGFGAGIAQGYATLGQIGFSERSGYTAIGTVCNLAARLCAEAKDGQILVSSRIAGAAEAVARLEDLGNLELKGLSRPVAAFNVSEPINGTSV
jgi:GAF domain-containing protein